MKNIKKVFNKLTITAFIISTMIGCTCGSSDNNLTECLLGFKLGMSKYDINKIKSNFKIGDNGYIGETEHYGLTCNTFNFNNSYLYLPPQSCAYYKGLVYSCGYMIEPKDLYSYIDYFKKYYSDYTFVPMGNNQDDEVYEFKKNDIVITIDYDKNRDIAIIEFVNRPIAIEAYNDPDNQILE